MPWVTHEGRHILIGEPGGSVGSKPALTQEEWEKGVADNRAQVLAIKEWAGTGSGEIRAVEARGQIKSEDDLVSYTPLVDNFHAAIDSAPAWQGEAYRGLSN